MIRGMRQGKGTFKSKDGSVYNGNWYNDKQTGNGEYTQNGKTSKGFWLDGKKVN